MQTSICLNTGKTKHLSYEEAKAKDYSFGKTIFRCDSCKAFHIAAVLNTSRQQGGEEAEEPSGKKLMAFTQGWPVDSEIIAEARFDTEEEKEKFIKAHATNPSTNVIIEYPEKQGEELEMIYYKHAPVNAKEGE